MRILFVLAPTLMTALLAARLPQLTDAERQQLVEEGKKVYQLQCQSCHGPEGNHPIPLYDLAHREFKHGDSVEQIAETVREGIPATAMQPFKKRLPDDKITAVAHYVRWFVEKRRQAGAP